LSEAAADPALRPFDAVLDRALAKDPAQRFATAMAMRAALQALATGPLPDVLPADMVLPPKVERLDAPPAAARSRELSPSTTPSPRPASQPGSAQGPVATSLPGTSQPSIPVPTGWDAQALADVERELAQHVGAVARVLVRRAARGQTSLAAVRHAVAGAIVDIDARDRFLARAGPLPRADTTPTAAASRFQATTTQVAAPGGVPMREGDVDKAAATLLASLGPIARVVARRCAANSPTREQFVARVLEQLAPTVDARRVRADLWRALS